MKSVHSKFLILSVASTALAGIVSFACGSTEGPLLVEHGVADSSTDTNIDVVPGDAGPTCLPTDDHTSNPEHCGRCDHSCGGGACSNGICQPVLLSTDLSPFSITSFGDRIYWGRRADSVDAGSVHSLRKDGSDKQISPGSPNSINGIYVDALGMLYTDGTTGNIWMAEDFTKQPQLRHASGGAGAGEIVADQTDIYWTDLYRVPGLVHASRFGSEAPTDLAPGATQYPWAVALKGDYVYWSNLGALAAGADAGAPTGSIKRTKKDGSGSPETLASDLSLPTYIALDDVNLYVADGLGHAVWRMPLGGGAAVERFADFGEPNAVAIDSEYVYVTDSDQGALFRVRKDKTGTRETLATNLLYPYKVTVDGNFVYWVNQSANAVMKVAKP